MKLTLQRTMQNEFLTTGILSLHLPVKFSCATIEPGTSHPYPAIPAGTYRITFLHSQRFDRAMPFLVEVPDRANIEIHPGNMPKDTHGCILVGERTKNIHFIKDSKATFKKLCEAMIEGAKLVVEIEILDAPETDQPSPYS